MSRKRWSLVIGAAAVALVLGQACAAWSSIINAMMPPDSRPGVIDSRWSASTPREPPRSQHRWPTTFPAGHSPMPSDSPRPG